MGKKNSIILIVILAGLLAVFLWNDHQKSLELEKRNAQMEAEIRPLQIELQDLERQLDDQEAYYIEQMNGIAAVTLLFTHAGEEIYDEAWPRLQSYGYCGMVALSEESFPGLEGCMSTAQFLELLDNGWSWCIVWPAASSNPRKACNELLARAESYGIGQASFIYFPEGSNQDGYEKWMQKNGYTAITGTVDWKDNSRRDRLNLAANNRKNLIYTIPFKQETKAVDKTVYLDSMLKLLDTYCQNNSIRIATAEEADKYRKEVKADSTFVQAEWESEKETLEQRITDIKEQISKIEEKYISN